MWMRNYQGKVIYFDISKYNNEKDLYLMLWKIKYNINIETNKMDFNKELLSLINS